MNIWTRNYSQYGIWELCCGALICSNSSFNYEFSIYSVFHEIPSSILPLIFIKGITMALIFLILWLGKMQFGWLMSHILIIYLFSRTSIFHAYSGYIQNLTSLSWSFFVLQFINLSAYNVNNGKWCYNYCIYYKWCSSIIFNKIMLWHYPILFLRK